MRSAIFSRDTDGIVLVIRIDLFVSVFGVFEFVSRAGDAVAVVYKALTQCEFEQNPIVNILSYGFLPYHFGQQSIGTGVHQKANVKVQLRYWRSRSTQ